MQLPYKQLPHHLTKDTLLPVYLLCGDVPLLIQEARDAIRNASHQSGYVQRKLFFVEPGFNWYELQQDIDNFSLFDEKCLLEIRNPKAKFDDHATKIISNYLKNPPLDKRLLIITDKLTSAQQQSHWYKAIDHAGAVIRVWPIGSHELPAWIRERFKQASLIPDHDSISLLAELTEGNLLATKQAIEKLRLLHPNETISTQMITDIIGNHARYNIFDLTNSVLLGLPKRVKRIIRGLRETNTETPLVLWALAREFRTLYTLAHELQHSGQSLSALLASQWQSRRAILQRALTRLRTDHLAALLQWAERIDRIIKGIRVGNSWEELERFSLSAAGDVL